MNVASLTEIRQSSARYVAPPEPAQGTLRLHCNEGAAPPFDLPPIAAAQGLARRYPRLDDLRREIASQIGCEMADVVVGAGADDVIDRVMRVYGGPGRRVVSLDPTFEMIPNYAVQSGAEVTRVAWVGEFPLEEVLDAGRGADVLALVTPDNPTGRVIPLVDVLCCASELSETIVLLDHAYVEYATQDYTEAVRRLPNVVVVRTFSKAWGLAGLRVGYAVAASAVAQRLRGVGSPYPVSALSVELVRCCLRSPSYVTVHVDRVAAERTRLTALLRQLGGTPWDSEANFVCARLPRAGFVYRALAAQGIAVRDLTARPGLSDALRMSCPGDESGFDRLCRALQTTMAPDALIFDMDGVLADVRASYRVAIARTCAYFGAPVNEAEITEAKRAGGANDDFELTWRLLLERGVQAELTEVTEVFQAYYDEGLWREEGLLIDRSVLLDLAARFSLGVVTGRPRVEAERFLRRYELTSLFDAMVCREDGPLKPSPDGVQSAMAQLGARTAWMFGDTVDDIVAGREAGALPVGVAAPDEYTEETRIALAAAGAATTWSSIGEVVKWL